MSEPAHLRGERTATVLLLAGGPAAALAVLAVSVLAVLLAPWGLWRPVIVVPLLVVAAVAVWRLARWLPVREGPVVPVWSALACLLIAVGFAVWAGMTHGEQLVLRRDAGSYALYAHWLAAHHGLPVDADLSAFGGPAALSVPGFTLDSPAYYQVLGGSGASTTAHIAPQFLLGAPALYSLGWWVAGWTGLLVAPAVLGGLALLAAAGLAARLVGPRWAPLAAAGLGLTQPMLHGARATFSEPPATLLVLAAAAVATDALEPFARSRARRLGALAGAMLGLAGLVRVDVLREVACLVPVCAALWIRRHPSAVPLGVAAFVGVGFAAIPAVVLARPYLHTVSGSLRPLVYGTVGLAALCLAVVGIHRRVEPRLIRRRQLGAGGRSAGEGGDGEPPGAAGAWLRSVLPWAAAALVLLVGAALAARPAWMTVHQASDDPGNALVASLQQQQGLPVDGARTYAERSVEWLLWYTGVPVAVAALLACAGASALVVRWWFRSAAVTSGPGGQGQAAGQEQVTPPRWLFAGLVGLGSVVSTLYRPGITPDHPWADRRLVPVVLPMVMIAGTAAAAWGVRLARRRMPVVVLVAAGIVAVLAVLAPPYEATRPLARLRTEAGEPAAVTTVCRQLRTDDVVVAVGDSTGRVRAQDEWVQVVRGVCGLPSAALRVSTGEEASLSRLDELVRGAGRRLVLLSAAEDDGSAAAALRGLGLEPVRAVLLHTTEDQHLLVRRPFARRGLVIDVWLAPWRAPGATAGGQVVGRVGGQVGR